MNCARGRVLDEEERLATLKEGLLEGVALDVFSQQLLGDETTLRQLLVDERVIVTLHGGASTVEAQVRVATEVARNIIAALRGDTLYGVATLPFPPTPA
jgi:D-3-phosphoglycerate dehydrogenase / 2-oxoglutarate reductase